MLCDKDYSIITHLGVHGWLSHHQLQLIECPSLNYPYDAIQRRMNRELYKNGWVDLEYLAKFNQENNDYWGKFRDKLPCFRLSAKGSKKFKSITGNDAYRPRWSDLMMPHRLETNQIIIELKHRGYIAANGFELEIETGSIRADAFINYKYGPFYLEVDYSGQERKEIVQEKWQAYEREYRQGNLQGKYVVWYSNRRFLLGDWIQGKTELTPIFIQARPKEIMKVINHIKGIKRPIKSGIK